MGKHLYASPPLVSPSPSFSVQDLNEYNHAVQRFANKDEYEKMRVDHCLVIVENNAKVEDAITGNTLNIKDQLVKVDVKASSQGATNRLLGRAVSDVITLTDILLTPSPRRSSGEHGGPSARSRRPPPSRLALPAPALSLSRALSPPPFFSLPLSDILGSFALDVVSQGARAARRRVAAPRGHAGTVREQPGGDASAERRRSRRAGPRVACAALRLPQADARGSQQRAAPGLLAGHPRVGDGAAGEPRRLLQACGVGKPCILIGCTPCDGLMTMTNEIRFRRNNLVSSVSDVLDVSPSRDRA